MLDDVFIMRESMKRKVKKMLEGRDPAHDFQHTMRLYNNAKLIGKREGADVEIYEPLLSLYIYPTIL